MPYCLNKDFSTTRLVINDRAEIEKQSSDKFESLLFFPEGNDQQNGGLRTQGHFKQSLSNKPLITIITVVYNGEDYLEQTIQSVINQTYDNVEYIIIDGGSTDGTLGIVRKYEHAIDYWMSEYDTGIYDAMNKGIVLSLGNWTNFMNVGDVFFNENVLLKLRKSLFADIVYGNHSIYIDSLDEYEIINVEGYKGRRNIPFCHQAAFIKTKILKENLFNVGYKIAADFDQYLKLKAINVTEKHIDLIVVKYLDGGVSAVSRKELIQEYYNITKKYAPYSALAILFVRRVKFFLIGV